MNFECHITCDIKDRKVVETMSLGTKWRFSAIDGDPVLGAKPHCYLTAHYTTFLESIEEINVMGDRLKLRAKVDTLRRKIELIVYDTKTGVGLPNWQA